MAEAFGQLIITQPGASPWTVRLNKTLYTIGRDPSNDITLSAGSVSRYHAELQFEQGTVLLTDLSSNGTFVLTHGERNRLLKDQPTELADGTVFQIEIYLLTYRAAQAESEDSPIPQPEVLPAPVEPSEPSQSLLSSPTPVKPPRKTYPLDVPLLKSVSLYLNFLPDIFHDADFLRRFLLIFEAIWEPLEQRQDHIAAYFDPRTCPVQFVDWIASWLGLQINPYWAESRKRNLLANAMELYRWRGTHRGLADMIEVCTGIRPEITFSSAQPFVFSIKMRLPTDGSVTPEQVEELVRAHKPACTGYTLQVK